MVNDSYSITFDVDKNAGAPASRELHRILGSVPSSPAPHIRHWSYSTRRLIISFPILSQEDLICLKLKFNVVNITKT